MTMNFRNVQASLISNILGPAEAGRYKTIGYQRQSMAGEEVKDSDRLVQVYYHSGDFKKSAGRNTGPTQHDIQFMVELTVSNAAKGDLSVLNNSGSTAAQRATALINFQEAAALADLSMDELFDIVYQVLMNGLNYRLGLDKGIVANRWVESFQKNEIIERGDLVVLTGRISFSCRVVEEVDGAEGVAGGTFEVNIANIGGDEEQKTEVSGDLGGS